MKGIIRKNLALLITTPRIYHHTKPPKFLRSNEVKQLLKTLLYTTPRELRASAFTHIACDLGLRIGEISKIRPRYFSPFFTNFWTLITNLSNIRRYTKIFLAIDIKRNISQYIEFIFC
jgi:Site-specific recombinase XerD